ncbi:holin [Streptomyces sp. AV19]|uniref:holin n=1 Tax=Streptomyces sp. AV19 TaxID=2793068 RepID=UPI0018FE951A|nr:holin [Streptomyces sp. AV19]MBH1939098.1 holin [Streptomyces sp. AV19]MDG4535338.1 holin [Streptomyces sp. AV19]
MTTSAFWLATFERMTRTFAQALLGVLGAGATGVLDAPWTGALSAAALAAVLALLTAIATSAGPEGPGLTETVRKAPE